MPVVSPLNVTQRHNDIPIKVRVGDDRRLDAGACELQASALLIRMDPLVRRDLPRSRQLDHPHRRRHPALLARPALQRRLQLPDRRIPRPADRIERQACSGLAAVTLDFEPGQSAVQALRDRRRRLSRPTIAFHPDRPRLSLGAVRIQDGLLSSFTSSLGADVGAHDATTPDYLPALRAHGVPLQPRRRLLAIHEV